MSLKLAEVAVKYISFHIFDKGYLSLKEADKYISILIRDMCHSSEHDAFLEKHSSDTLKIERLENKII